MIKIAFLGDIAFVGKYDLKINPNAKNMLAPLAEKLNDYDLVVANLETPLTDKKKTWTCKSMHLRSPKMNVELLNYLGVNAVSLANNHIFDFGKDGFLDTIGVLDNNSINWFGANNRTFYVEKNGERIAFSGFCCYSTHGARYLQKDGQFGVNLITYNNVMNQLQSDIKNGFFSVFSFHWGLEHVFSPNYEHICLAKRLAKKKDLLIHGHHPHVMQGVQKINNSLIAYSLGNCVFDDCVSINGSYVLKQNSENRKSFLLEVIIENGVIQSHFCHGFKQNNGVLSFFDIGEEISFLSRQIDEAESQESYEKKRQLQFCNVVLDKFGKRNIAWLRSRMNYYSIGARLLAFFQNRKYNKERKKILEKK